ncbi:MAG: glycosyltransferase family 39 protein, partial [Planctomycetes bacterium]|nr:glycosyltransferase family 39 protein [Planctomycetota bacterium]
MKIRLTIYSAVLLSLIYRALLARWLELGGEEACYSFFSLAGNFALPLGDRLWSMVIGWARLLPLPLDMAVRIPSLLLGSACLMLYYRVGVEILGPRMAVRTVLLLHTLPIFVVDGFQATPRMAVWCVFLGVWWLCTRAASAPELLAAGILTGLGCALDEALLLSALSFAVAGIPLPDREERRRFGRGWFYAGTAAGLLGAVCLTLCLPGVSGLGFGGGIEKGVAWTDGRLATSAFLLTPWLPLVLALAVAVWTMRITGRETHPLQREVRLCLSFCLPQAAYFLTVLVTRPEHAYPSPLWVPAALLLLALHGRTKSAEIIKGVVIAMLAGAVLLFIPFAVFWMERSEPRFGKEEMGWRGIVGRYLPPSSGLRQFPLSWAQIAPSPDAFAFCETSSEAFRFAHYLGEPCYSLEVPPLSPPLWTDTLSLVGRTGLYFTRDSDEVRVRERLGPLFRSVDKTLRYPVQRRGGG